MGARPSAAVRGHGRRAQRKARMGATHSARGGTNRKVWWLRGSRLRANAARAARAQPTSVVRSVRSVPPLPTVAKAR
jgi:hypothetical protein